MPTTMPQSSANVCAAIDIGSNSFRLLIGTYNHHINILCKELFTVRLAEGFNESCIINPKALDRASTTLRSMAILLREYNVQKVRICGTEALRRAHNSNILLSECQEILGFPLEIIDGQQEALLSHAGVLSELSSPEDSTLIVDVGGGSTECILSDISQHSPVSIPLGAMSLTDSFFRDNSQNYRNIERSQALVQRFFSPYLIKIKSFVSTLVACGGTATALASLHHGLEQYDENIVQETTLACKELQDIFNSLLQLKAKERCQLPGLDQGRGEILLGGSLIFLVLQNFLQTEEMIISDRGLLEGIFLSQF
jgi:exopolyphosphatase / guanosine-5'-triphosphate,3'-diphosphate pyrophosphatase